MNISGILGKLGNIDVDLIGLGLGEREDLEESDRGDSVDDIEEHLPRDCGE